MNERQQSQDPTRREAARTGLSPAMFDHEKLDVYQIELQFIAWVTDLLDEVIRTAKGKTAEVCDQLDRASLSALLNTAEGNGKRQRQVRAKSLDDARGSANECAACLDALVAKRCATMERVQEGKVLPASFQFSANWLSALRLLVSFVRTSSFSNPPNP